MRIHRLPMLLAAALSLLVARGAVANDLKEVTAEGEATIENGDKAGAKAEALKRAKRAAVESAAGVFIVSTSDVKDFELVKDRVLTSTDGYLSGEPKVLESKEEDGTWKVKIQAKVGVGKLRTDAMAAMLLNASLGFPRIALLVTEQHVGESAPSAWWGPQGGGAAPGGMMTMDQRLAENLIIESWREKGFTFVDLEALSGKLKSANLVTNNPSANQIRELANLTDADVIITGTAIATKSGDLGAILNDRTGTTKMNSCNAALSLRAFNSDSGEIISTASGQKTTTHVSLPTCERNALRLATGVVNDDLYGLVLEAWRKRVTGQSRVRMTVRNIDGYKTLTEFKKALEAMNVKFDQKAFRNGTADLDLQLEGGDTEALAGDIESAKLGKVKARVVGVTANTIDIEMVR